jgi:hypothetical protein
LVWYDVGVTWFGSKNDTAVVGRVPTGTAPKALDSGGRDTAGTPSRRTNALWVVACETTKLAAVENPSAATSPMELLTVGPWKIPVPPRSTVAPDSLTW